MHKPGKKTWVIGIAGGTGSGKSTFADAVRLNLDGADLNIIRQDSYYRPLDHLTMEERDAVNFDHPDSLDFDQLAQDIKNLKAGNKIAVPEYDFVTHTRSGQTRLVESPRILIVEGILIFSSTELRHLFDIKVFIDTDADERLMRRIRRDTQERGRDLDAVLHQYCHTVKPMHLKFVEPSKRWADIIIPLGGRNKIGLDLISRKMHMILCKDYPEELHLGS